MKQKAYGSTANTFGAFLQTIQKRGVEKRPSRDLSLDILRILKNRSFSVPELLKDIGEEPGQIINTLSEMERTGLVALTGDQEKSATLTKSGKTVLENYNSKTG